MSPENQWLEDVFPTEIVRLLADMLVFGGCKLVQGSKYKPISTGSWCLLGRERVSEPRSLGFLNREKRSYPWVSISISQICARVQTAIISI